MIDEVVVSCAAIIRKIMWSTIAAAGIGAPSSSVARQTREKMSSPVPSRRPATCGSR